MQSITIGNEGLAIAFIPSHSVWLAGFFLSWALGVVAGAYPAWQASSHSIVENLRAS
jgi:ABC-type lipoprotein release transport system permease subunit